MKNSKVINKRQGIVFILSAPSGTGKTTVISGLLERFPEIYLSVSYTTRAPRARRSARARLPFYQPHEILGDESQGRICRVGKRS